MKKILSFAAAVAASALFAVSCGNSAKEAVDVNGEWANELTNSFIMVSASQSRPS